MKNGAELSGQPNKSTQDVGNNKADYTIKNSFREQLNSRNPKSPYYVKNLDLKEKEAIEKTNKESKEPQEIENSLDK